MQRLTTYALGLTHGARVRSYLVCTSRAQCLHFSTEADAKGQAAKTWTPVVDPFTSSMQSKAEKELLDQVLKQADEQEQAEDAAEQVHGKQSATQLALIEHSIE